MAGEVAMQSFAEFAAENFHSEVLLNWKLVGTTHAIAAFSAKTLKVEVSFEQREENGPWHVGFEVLQGESEERTTVAFRIFNGVFQAVREFVETQEPEIVVFISKNDDVERIYETYLRREKASLEALGYRLEGPDRVEPYAQFTLRRMRPSEWRG
jgi:hypothetical protein